jgi:hypothetical protein
MDITLQWSFSDADCCMNKNSPRTVKRFDGVSQTARQVAPGSPAADSLEPRRPFPASGTAIADNPGASNVRLLNVKDFHPGPSLQNLVSGAQPTIPHLVPTQTRRERVRLQGRVAKTCAAYAGFVH